MVKYSLLILSIVCTSAIADYTPYQYHDAVRDSQFDIDNSASYQRQMLIQEVERNRLIKQQQDLKFQHQIIQQNLDNRYYQLIEINR